ncbi:MAG: T9SS type A sorting domain-containing protein, partial [Bacteroidota bacterium]|nr:T9SS type A sorting domain-containing protein [Bacteroidota bacterium]MDX5431026.1 T9SS type A sorting domain-containing protein [Bacteroidota bacterium]MDX5469777.1 T9SS type A sorting domain-containing protein [Bacteroidota bacterium]
ASLFAVNVTFSVDMTGQTVDASGVHIAGSFQSEAGAGGDWLPGATALADQGGGIWSVTVDIPAGYYEYKFINGTNWGQDETPGNLCKINGNRAVSVGSADMSVPVTLFAQCASSDPTILFQLDMKGQSFINPNGIHVAGSFQSEVGASGDWQPGETMLFSPDGDSIYKFVGTLPVGTYEYKFLNGNSWGDDESVPAACNSNGNRGLNVIGGVAQVLPAVGFGQCPPGVVFRVDMTDQTVSPNGVHVAGSFQGWDPAATAMTDGDGDGIYEVTVQMGAGTYEYKFINGNSWGSEETVPADCQVNGNRSVTITGGTTLAVVKFGACLPLVTITVDMSNETVTADSVHIAGNLQDEAGANGDWDPSATQMTHIGNNIYQFSSRLPAGTYEFKFVNGNAWGKDESVPGACNQNGNRFVVVGSTDVTAPTVCFGQCTHPCVTNPDPADITFKVDMSQETVDASGVWLMGSITSPQWQSGSVQMTDDDGDKVYEVTVNVSGAAEFQYKFTNGDPRIAQFQNGEMANFDSLGCGVSNGLGAYNRIHTRTGVAEVLEIVSYDACSRLSTSLSDNTLSGLVKVFPNPAGEVLNVSYTDENAGAFVVELYDLSGKQILVSNAAMAGTLSIDVSSLDAGAYIIYVKDVESGKSVRQKLMIQ